MVSRRKQREEYIANILQLQYQLTQIKIILRVIKIKPEKLQCFAKQLVDSQKEKLKSWNSKKQPILINRNNILYNFYCGIRSNLIETIYFVNSKQFFESFVS
ncbi:hypothetical protein ABPG74_021154 [Tetrahymena malaccensis]